MIKNKKAEANQKIIMYIIIIAVIGIVLFGVYKMDVNRYWNFLPSFGQEDSNDSMEYEAPENSVNLEENYEEIGTIKFKERTNLWGSFWRGESNRYEIYIEEDYSYIDIKLDTSNVKWYNPDKGNKRKNVGEWKDSGKIVIDFEYLDERTESGYEIGFLDGCYVQGKKIYRKVENDEE